jgi:hypothetical protein
MQAAGAEVLGHFASTSIRPISPDFRDSAGSLREDRTLILSFQSRAEQGREEISHSYSPPPGLKGRPTVANKGDPANQRAGIFSKANQRKSFGPAC